MKAIIVLLLCCGCEARVEVKSTPSAATNILATVVEMKDHTDLLERQLWFTVGIAYGKGYIDSNAVERILGSNFWKWPEQ